MAKFSVDGDEYGEGTSNPTRAKKRKITSGEEEEDDDVEIEPEATEDRSVTAAEDDEEHMSEEEGNDAVADEADQINEESDDDDEPVLFRSNLGSIGGRAGEIPSVTVDRDKSISVVLTDPEVFDCAICYEPLISPVYQVSFLSICTHDFYEVLILYLCYFTNFRYVLMIKFTYLTLIPWF